MMLNAKPYMQQSLASSILGIASHAVCVATKAMHNRVHAFKQVGGVRKSLFATQTNLETLRNCFVMVL